MPPILPIPPDAPTNVATAHATLARLAAELDTAQAEVSTYTSNVDASIAADRASYAQAVRRDPSAADPGQPATEAARVALEAAQRRAAALEDAYRDARSDLAAAIVAAAPRHGLRTPRSVST